MTALSDVADLVGLVVAAVAAGVAAYELHQATRDRREARRAELDGVAVTWRPYHRPNRAETDGTAVWMYEITAQNPGRLPVKDVRVTLTFPADVRRRHYDGTVDAPVRVVEVGQAALLAGTTRVWRRYLVIRFESAHELGSIRGDITFTPARGPRRTNHMDERATILHDGR